MHLDKKSQRLIFIYFKNVHINILKLSKPRVYNLIRDRVKCVRHYLITLSVSNELHGAEPNSFTKHFGGG